MTDPDFKHRRCMWQEVVNRAFLDALTERPAKSRQSTSGVTQDDKDEAIAWFERGGKDFQETCINAGYDPDFIQGVFRDGRFDMDRFKLDESGMTGPQRARRNEARKRLHKLAAE